LDFNRLLDILTEIGSNAGKDLINKLEETKDLHKILMNLSDQERKEILRKITLFAQCDSSPEQKDPSNNTYQPPLTRLDFVHCNFTGVGYEWDGPHYGVVWEVNPKFDAITIIPVTSKPRKEYANVIPVGRILGLPPGNTTLLVSDMTKVSRKRLTPVEFNHYTKGRIRARLKREWIPRIVEAIAVTYGTEITLEEFVKQSTMVAMPENLDVLRKYRFKPIRGRYDRQKNIMYYRVWNEDIWNIVVMKNPNIQMSKTVKIKLIDELFSDNPTIRAQAEQNYRRWYH
jgi:hypothetical protein